MTHRHRPPNRQPRGSRATLSKIEPESLPPCGFNPYPEINWDGGTWAAHNHNFCACWHQYDECPCFRVDHVPAHLAAECDCTWEETDTATAAVLAQLPSVAVNPPD